jgi:hypothetical protein
MDSPNHEILPCDLQTQAKQRNVSNTIFTAVANNRPASIWRLSPSRRREEAMDFDRCRTRELQCKAPWVNYPVFE